MSLPTSLRNFLNLLKDIVVVGIGFMLLVGMFFILLAAVAEECKYSRTRK